VRRYRAAGADPPFGDPARAHGARLEGYYWRIVQPGAGRVLVALCGVCRDAAGPWALVTLAAHPGGFARSAICPAADADFRGFGVGAGGVLRGSRERVTVALGPDAGLEAELSDPVPFPRGAFGALGAAQVVPGLPQYWHPVLLAARVRGSARVDGEVVDLDGATAYVEKNWGGAFPGRWWWGHAGAFGDAAVTVAFAGGPVAVARARVSPTAVVVRLGREVLRLAPPLARSRVALGQSAWRIAARGPGVAVELEGDAAGVPPHTLEVPVPNERRTDPRSSQHLAARMALTVRRGRRCVFAGESPLAGFEIGRPASPPASSSRASG
jgi:hypothetical protein